MEVPSKNKAFNEPKKDTLKLYFRITKINLIFCFLLGLSLVFPFIEGDYYDSRGTETPSTKKMYYNGFWIAFDAITSQINIILTNYVLYLQVFVLSLLVLIFGALFHFLRRKKIFQVEDQISLIDKQKKFLFLILISGIIILGTVLLSLIVGLNISIDPTNPLDMNYIRNSDDIFFIYDRITYGFYLTMFISFIIIVTSAVGINLSNRITESKEANLA
ncbi:MAG: hypothetical protein ACW98F_01400 [Candidatus Hodarchaeales archaeon]|jgi:hypothetical protein